MATATNADATDRSIPSRVKPYRLSVKQFLAMADAGILPGDTRFELLGGLVVRRMKQNPPHSSTVGRLGRSFNTLLAGAWIVNEEKPVQLGPRWLPVPDIAILLGPDRRYDLVMPSAAEVVLVVEVADSSYTTDRGYKLREYADANIPTYWIVNLVQRRVEVYRQPRGKGLDAAYASVEVYSNDSAVPVIIGGQEVGRLNVADLLPSAPVEGL